MRSIRRWLLMVSLLVLAGSLPPVWATSFYARPFPETVQDAPVIVRGKAGNSYSDWSRGPDGTKRIYTFFELQVDEVFKGQIKGSSIVMRELGGEKDGIGMAIAGAAQFQRGEDVVVMLGERNEDGTHDIQGLMTGKYNVRRDQSGKEYLQGGLPDEHGHGELGSQADTSADAKPTLEDLRKIIAAQGKTPPVAASPQNSEALRPSPSPIEAPSGSAPRLQPSPPQGASESPQQDPEDSSSESGWRIWAAAALLAGGLGIWAMARNRK